MEASKLRSTMSDVCKMADLMAALNLTMAEATLSGTQQFCTSVGELVEQ